MKRRFKPYIPAVITGNVRSLANKKDELGALARIQRKYKECSIVFLRDVVTQTDTRLKCDYPWIPHCADRHTTVSSKKKGEGLAILVKSRWCNLGQISIKEHVCKLDIELIAIRLCPYYLPKEFINAIVYISCGSSVT